MHLLICLKLFGSTVDWIYDPASLPTADPTMQAQSTTSTAETTYRGVHANICHNHSYSQNLDMQLISTSLEESKKFSNHTPSTKIHQPCMTATSAATRLQPSQGNFTNYKHSEKPVRCKSAHKIVTYTCQPDATFTISSKQF